MTFTRKKLRNRRCGSRTKGGDHPSPCVPVLMDALARSGGCNMLSSSKKKENVVEC